MSPRHFPLVLARLVLLMGTAALSQPQAPARELKRQRVLVTGAGATPVAEVRVAPGFATTLLFDAPLVPGAVTLEGPPGHFAHVEVREHFILLVPARALAPAERRVLTVRFADEQAPTQAAFALVEHPSEVDTQVDVVRRPLSVEALQAQLAAERARCAAGVLSGLILSGVLGKEGVTSTVLKRQPTAEGVVVYPGNPARLYRAGRRWAVAVTLSNPEGAAPWVPGEARLHWLGENGQPVGETSRLPVHLTTPQLAPGESGWMVVEWDVPEEGTPGVVSLELTDHEGRRSVHWPPGTLTPPPGGSGEMRP